MRAPTSSLIRPSSEPERPFQKTRQPPTVKAPGDVYEKEADRVAGQILSASGLEGPQAGSVHGTSDMTAPPAVQEALASSGQPLDPATRGLMESRFGHDFGNVRVHTDGQASESARQIDAAAYTSGSDIVFGAGRYAPETAPGQRLIAHELTHVVQQSGAAAAGQVVQRQPASSTPPVPSLDLRENMTPTMAAALGSTVVDQFALGSATIPKAGEASLRDAAANILFFLKKYPASTVHIAGHTDAVDTEERNLTLGEDRAKAVSSFLQNEGGVPADIITTESKGESSPVVPTKDGAAEPRNRRVSVSFRVNNRMFSLGLDYTLKPPTFEKPAPTPKPNLFPPPIVPIEEPTFDDKMRDLDRRLKNAPKPKEPRSASEVFIDGVMDTIAGPIIKKFPKSWQKPLENAARKGLEAGTEKACDAAFDAVSVEGSEKEALKAACKAALKQKPK